MHIFTKKIFFNPNLKTLNTYRLTSSRFAFSTIFSLESLKICSAYAKTSLGPKMEKIPPDYHLIHHVPVLISIHYESGEKDN